MMVLCMSMKLRFTPWVIILGLLLLAELCSLFGILPISSIDIFWMAVTVACLWGIATFLLPRK